MTRDAAWFEALYAADPDPWAFETSDYERDKYAATLAALPRARFASALEIGCSIGVFTHALAACCERLRAVDVSATALARARERCAGLHHVSLERRAVPDDWPDAAYDLIVVSEVLYFLTEAQILGIAARVTESLLPGGCLLLVNWRGETGTDFSGEAAANLFLAALPANYVVTTSLQPAYRLDCVLS